MLLTKTQCDRAQPNGRRIQNLYSVNGLRLQVGKNSGKSWVQRVYLNGRPGVLPWKVGVAGPEAARRKRRGPAHSGREVNFAGEASGRLRGARMVQIRLSPARPRRGGTQPHIRVAVDEIDAVSFAGTLDVGLFAIVYTDVDRHDMPTGVNVAATRRMAEVAKAPVDASGGVRSLADLKSLKALGFGRDELRAISGSALYAGTLDFGAALPWLLEKIDATQSFPGRDVSYGKIIVLCRQLFLSYSSHGTSEMQARYVVVPDCTTPISCL